MKDQWIEKKPIVNQWPNSIKKKPEKNQNKQKIQVLKIEKIAIKGEPLLPK